MNASYGDLRYRVKLNVRRTAWTVRFLYPGCEHPIERVLSMPGGQRGDKVMSEFAAEGAALAMLADVVKRKRLRCWICGEDRWRLRNGLDMHHSRLLYEDGLRLLWNGAWPILTAPWPEAFLDWRARRRHHKIGRRPK